MSNRKLRVVLRFWNPFGLDPTRDYSCLPARWKDRVGLSSWSVTVNGRGKNGLNFDKSTRFYLAVAFGFGIFVFDLPKGVAR